MKYLLYRSISLSALLGLSSCGQSLSVSQSKVSNGGGEESKLKVILLLRNHLMYPDTDISISPMSVVPNGFDQNFINNSYLNKGTEELSVHASYSMSYEHLKFKLKNTLEEEMVINNVSINFLDPNVTLAPESYPLTIPANSEYEISLAGNCVDVDWSGEKNVLKLSIDIDSAPDFNSDIIVTCGY